MSHRSNLSLEKLEKVDAFHDAFDAALGNDMNTPQALAVVWETVKSNIPSSDKYDLLVSFDEVLGLKLSDVRLQSSDVEIPVEIQELAKKREQLRKEKKFVESDVVRDQIIKEGYMVEDLPSGPKVSKK